MESIAHTYPDSYYLQPQLLEDDHNLISENKASESEGIQIGGYDPAADGRIYAVGDVPLSIPNTFQSNSTNIMGFPSATLTGPLTERVNSNYSMVMGYPTAPANNFHLHRAQCSWPNCTESFARTTDVGRHIQSVHYGIKHHCYWIEANGAPCSNNRGNGYCRLEKLRSHQRQKHGFTLV